MQLLPEQPAVAPVGVAAQQLVPQRVLLQLISQPVWVHTAVPLELGGLHLVPQLKQFDVSVARLTQEDPHRLKLPQSATQLPLWQT